MRFPRLHNRIRRLCAVTAVAVLLAVVPGSYEPVAAIAQTRSADTKNKKKGGSSKSKTQASSKSSAKKSAGRQSSTGQSRAKQSAAKQSSQKKNAVRNSSGKKSGAKGSAQSPKSSAEAKKMQEAAQKEIQKTKEQISLNEQEIKTGLADLNLLSSEISQCRAQVSGLEKKVASLEKSITDISSDIVKNETDLRVMREEYLKAVRKMRLTGKNQSVLAFLFSSDSFNQAMRRLRYMRRFSEWKERRSADIDTRIRRLAEEREHLDSVKVKQTAALGSLAKAQAGLEEKHGRQEKLVAGLRHNGDMLQSHLASKQAEANRLRSTIADLIAAEQAKAEADRKARERQEAKRLAREKAEAERKAAAEREAAEKAAAAERAAAEKAEAERKAAEKIAAEKAAAAKAAAEKAALEKTVAAKAAAEKAEADRKAAEKAAKDKARVEKEARRLEEKKIKEEEKRIKNSEKGSRTKKDRKKTGQPSVHREVPQAQTRPAYGDNFAGLKGTLPRPVDGSWRITNPFGRHSMPELPEIVYDNPGIDAEVATGAAVKSVYGGKVSGVYKVAGYGTVVIVNHGEYYTVYGNLSSAGVSVGTNVSGGQTIGNAGTDPDDPRRGSVHFEVWKGREKQNPSQWIR